jgi:hypothetical protein
MHRTVTAAAGSSVAMMDSLELAQGHLKFPLPIPFVSCPNDNSQLWRRLWENPQRRNE